MESVIRLKSSGSLKLCLDGSTARTFVLGSSFYGNSLKNLCIKPFCPKNYSCNFKIVSEVNEEKQSSKDKWKGLAFDTSDDQQDITRGKGMVDSLFQAPMNSGTHNAVMSSYDYFSAGIRQYNIDNYMDGLYIAPAFMDKLVIHIAKNFLNLPNIKVPLILGVWGGKGQGKSFQCELVLAKMGINPIMMSAGELESGNAGEPAKLIRQRYREASDIIKKGKMCVLFINDLDAGAGRMGGTTQYTVNNQMVNATLMNIADNPTNVQLPGMYNKQENPRVPVIVTGNDFSTLYAPLIRDGRMEKFYWAPTREDRIGICIGIFKSDNVPDQDIVNLVDTFSGQSIDFFGALRARVYDDEVRKFVSGIGVENVGKRLVNSKEGLPELEQPKMTIHRLLEYGNMLVEEQENVNRVQLSDKYLREAALGDANEDAIIRGTFYACSQLDDFIFNGFKQPNTNLSLSGTAKVDKHGILQLTNNTGRLMGHALFPTPIQFKNSYDSSVLSFSTCFAFNIVPEYPKLGGHGLAFTIAPSQDFIKSALPSQYLGLLNATDVGNFSNHLFAVEFDTVQDFEFGDINDNHVGININSLVSNKSAKAAYFSDDLVEQDLNLKSGKTIVVWIEYDSITNLVNVTLSPSSSKPRLPILSYHLDLSPIFEKTMYIGFSSSTGLLASSHYVLGWSFKINGDAKFLTLKSLPSLPEHKKTAPVLIVIVSVLAVLVFGGSIFLAICAIKKYKNRDIIEDWELEIGPHRFSYRELKKATKGFKESELLGSGGFGKVYKGTLPSSKLEVAVKRISNESKQGLREFVSEISTIGKLRHRNLVQLQGWCRLRGDLLLVYDYMPNASLDRFLFEKPIKVLNWGQRFNIIKGVASGLFYLHEEYEQIVIHRDIKASNVLLDADLNGRVGDFGMAKLYEHGENPTTTRVVGTLGYLAPELPRTGRATTSSDVFAFGALLLEVVCGRRPIENRAPPEEFVLVDWVWDKWIQGRPFDVVDKRLEGEYDENEVVIVLKLGLMCSNHAVNARPSMRQVVRYLEGEVGLPAVVRPPGEYYDGGRAGVFDNINSFASSSFDKGSLYSDGTQVDVDLSFASPISLLDKKGEAR